MLIMQTKTELRKRLKRYKKHSKWKNISKGSKLGIHWLTGFMRKTPRNNKPPGYKYENLVRLEKFLDKEDKRELLKWKNISKGEQHVN